MLSVTLNPTGIVPSANNRFLPPNVIGNTGASFVVVSRKIRRAGTPAPALLDVIIEESMIEKNGRIEIPQNVAAELLFLADRTCCVCRQRLRPVQIHHIDDDPTNNIIENLAVLCFDCHRETQIRGGFDRKLDAAQIQLYKVDWNRRVEAQRSTATLPAAPPLANGETLFLRYFQIREKNEEYFYDFEADYALVGTSDAVADGGTNQCISTFITSSHQKFREGALNSIEGKKKAKQMMTASPRSQFGYWDSLAISHRASLYTPKVLSLEFLVYSFGAGAAHGYAATKTMNFQLRPSRELHLADVFNSSKDYLAMLSRYCFDDLRKQQVQRQSDHGMSPDPWKESHDDWLLKGAEAKNQNYERFSLAKGGMTIHFDPYSVACYAEGKYEVFIPAYILKPMMNEAVANLLEWQ